MAKLRVDYRAIIETIFFDHYSEGITEFEFERKEIEAAAIRLKVVEERHYRLVPADRLDPKAVRDYRD